MSNLYTAKLDEIKENTKEFYELAKKVNPELTAEQFRATLTDGSTINWPYSGTKYCAKCHGDVLRPYFYPEDPSINPDLFDSAGVPKHTCEPATRDPQTGEWKNSTGMPTEHQHITIDPEFP